MTDTWNRDESRVPLERLAGRRLKERIEADFLDRYAHGKRCAVAGGEGSDLCLPAGGGAHSPRTLVALEWEPTGEGWHAGLRSCLEGLAPGDHLALSLPSLDHLRATGREGDEGVALAELHEIAGLAGGSLARVEPCGLVYWDGLPNHWLSGSLAGDLFAWRRYLSWLDVDDAFLELGLFLHRNLLAHLGTVIGERFLAMIVKDGGGDDREMVRAQALNTPDFPVSLEGLSPVLPLDAATWKAELGRLLAVNLRCRMYYFRLLSAAQAREDRVAWRSFLPETVEQEFLAWWEMERREQSVMEVTRTWHRLEVFREALTYGGLPLGPGLEYEAQPMLLRNHGLLFSGGHE